MPSAGPDNPTDAHALLRDRCAALGLPTWRLDTSGTILEEPTELATAGLWLRSSRVTALIIEATRRLEGRNDPDLIELFPGCWVIVLTERRRRLRVSYLFALAMSPRALEHPEFERAALASQLDPQAAQRAMLPYAKFDHSAATCLSGALSWMIEDIVRLGQHEHSITGFTRQLTDSFETIDLLYALGRSMHDLRQPELFTQFVCDRIRSSLPFGWVAASFDSYSDPALDFPGIAGRIFASGPLPANPEFLHQAVQALDLNAQCVVPGLPGIDLGIGAQVVVQPIGRAGRTTGFLLLGNKHGDDPHVSSYDLRLIEAAATYVGAFLENAALYSEQERLFLGTVEAMTAAIDAKDPYTCGHSRRVAALTAQLARALGMSPDDVEKARVAGLVHDVGKIGIPESVLCKQGRLTDDEFGLIKQHPEMGHRILKDISPLRDVLPGVLYHHERYDGKGYPHGLAGNAIPLIARMLCLADTFDAMSSSRSYRPALPREKILDELRRCSGTQFDPDLLTTFLNLSFEAYDAMLAERSAQIFVAKAA
jgi:HD-GYP domain-containing protein (c-di-GMP phosphodiesterase class II)